MSWPVQLAGGHDGLPGLDDAVRRLDHHSAALLRHRRDRGLLDPRAGADRQIELCGDAALRVNEAATGFEKDPGVVGRGDHGEPAPHTKSH
jgi:hypothetical protein